MSVARGVQGKRTLRRNHLDRPDPGLKMTKADIDRFLDEWETKGCLADTLEHYRSILERFYHMLPGDKRIRRDTLASWQEELRESGYAPATINKIFSVCNTWLDFMGCREYQQDLLGPEDRLQPELTRSEYHRLLQTAKVLGKERTYMLVKILGSCNIRIQELPKVTVEALTEGKLTTAANGLKQTIRLPECLRKELLAYAERQGIGSGPIFISRNETPMLRTRVAAMIKQLGVEAQISEGKANARALRRLWMSTRANIESNLELLVEQAMERQLEQEQLTVGWEDKDG